jgi:hypothetical protein
MANIKDTSNDLVDIQGQLEKVLSKYEKLNNFNFNQMWDGLKNSIKESTTETEKLNFQYKSVNGQINDSLKLMEKVSKSKKGGIIESEKMLKLGNQLQNQIDKRLHIEEQLKQIARAESIRQKSSLTWVSNKFKEIKQLVTDHPIIIIDMATLYILKQIYNIFDQLDSAAADFRKSVGITRDDSEALESMARDIAINYMRLGVSAKDVYGSIKGIANEIGSTQYATKSVVENMSLFQAQLGISTKTSAGFLKTMAMISRSTTSSQKDMMLFAQHMSAAAGVPLDIVMEDVASASQSGYQYLPHNALELTKAAIQAKLMGTSLQSSVKSSSELLNFTQNVKDEMEASVLLGHGLNLQKARELAYGGHIAEMNKEILRLAKENKFEQLDRYQMEAVAKALGKSSGEIAAMLEADREHNNVLKAMTPEMRKQYDLLTNARQSQVKDYADIAKKEIESLNNQKAIAGITSAWNSIFARLGEVILPKIATILTTIATVLNKLEPVSNNLISAWLVGISVWKLMFGMIKETQLYIKTLGMVFSVVVDRIDLWYNGASKIANIFKFIVGIFKNVGVGISKFVGEFTKIIGAAGEFGGIMSKFIGIGAFFGKWLTPIGWIITAIQFIYNLFQRFNNVDFVKGDWIGNIWKGIKAVSGAIYDTLLKPFVEVWNWLKGMFLGNSPSQLGLMIVDGIMAVESMLIKALISPFEKAWEFIKGLPLISHLFGGKNVGVEAVPQPRADVSIDKPKVDIDSKKSTTNNVVTDTTSMNDIFSKKIDLVVDAINSLRTDFKNGTITANVFLDSQKLDSAMGRRLSYTGTLT